MNPQRVHAVVASAPGKLILMGEHAAVHGCPAVIAALGLRCEAVIERRNDPGVLLDLPDVDVKVLCTRDELIGYALDARNRWATYAAQGTPQAFTQLRGMDPAHLAKVVIGETALRVPEHPTLGILIRLRSAIPLGAGFGSSAAAAVSLAGALLAMERSSPSLKQIGEIALEAERRQHGRPSGIDHNTALLGGIVRATRDEAGVLQVEPISAGRTVPYGFLKHFCVYHTGPAAEPTGAVVTAVSQHFSNADRRLLDNMERATHDLLALFDASGTWPDRLVDIVRRYESYLEQLGVVPPGVQQAIRAVEHAGGAAKICGAGALSGEGAGALLVVWPGEPPDPLPPPFSRFQRISATLAVPGFSVERA